MKKSTLFFLAAAFAIGLLAALFFSQEKKGDLTPSSPPPATDMAPDVEEKPEPVVRLPVSPPPSEQVEEEQKPALPSLEKSDPEIRKALTPVLPQAKLLDMFIFDHLIRRFVLMVDSLPRSSLSYNHLPVYTPYSRFIPREKDGRLWISSKNFRRYATFVELVKMVDMKDAAGMYHRYYPLFQKAYRELGYPNAGFNDRFIEVIDHLLATPPVKYPVQLVQPHIRYQYADPALEALSSGQKLLIRMGPDNTAIILEKLRKLRPLLANPAPENG